MNIWYEFKLLLEHATGVSMDAYHILVGVGVQLLVATLLGASLARWRPWLAVLILALLNEFSDLWVEQWPDPAIQYGEGVKDIVLTLVLPTTLLVAARRWPSVLVGDPGSRPKIEP